MKKTLGILALSIFCMMLSTAQADEVDTTLDIGFWSYHFEREYEEDECVNEKHDAIVLHKNNISVGGYKNTHCKQSFVLGYNRAMYKEADQEITVEVMAVSGYPKSMHVAVGLIVIPTINYRAYLTDSMGIKIVYVPSVLVGVGFSHRF